MRVFALLAGLLAAALFAVSGASADIVAPVSAIRAGVIVSAEHLTVLDAPAPPGVAEKPEEIVGMEARTTLYQNRPIRFADLGPPTLVRRNDVVKLLFQRGTLTIRAEGKALGEGGMGERIRVMNLDSRIAVFGRIAGPSLIEVSQ